MWKRRPKISIYESADQFIHLEVDDLEISIDSWGMPPKNKYEAIYLTFLASGGVWTPKIEKKVRKFVYQGPKTQK